ncbi:MAG: ABC transporter permease subunit [Opitutaceae bacterium]|nr:ABC transporter permease subunit [Opitutaceae bacterium]
MMLRIVRYVAGDILRGRIILAYAGCLLVASLGLFNLGGDTTKALIGLLSLVLMIVPLVSVVFTTAHFYNTQEFVELLAAQPLPRATILLAQMIGVMLALTAALLAGIAVPVLLYACSATGLTLIAVALLLTAAFTALAFVAAVLARDKARGIGAALLIWFYFGLLHDGLTLYALFLLEDFPLEGISLTLLALNPIDLGRVLVLLQMDVSALMGYTGAMLKDLLGSGTGIGFAVLVLGSWIAAPVLAALWIFRRKDL